MTTLHIIRGVLEFLGVVLAALSIYKADEIEARVVAFFKPSERDKPVQFNARDIFYIEEENQ